MAQLNLLKVGAFDFIYTVYEFTSIICILPLLWAEQRYIIFKYEYNKYLMAGVY